MIGRTDHTLPSQASVVIIGCMYYVMIDPPVCLVVDDFNMHTLILTLCQLQSMPLLPHSLTTSCIFLLPLFLLALIAAFNMATKPSNNNLNGNHSLLSFRRALQRVQSHRKHVSVSISKVSFNADHVCSLQQSSKSLSPSSPRSP